MAVSQPRSSSLRTSVKDVGTRAGGGIEYDPDTQRWRLIVHLWYDDAGRGPPDQAFAWSETYATDSEAEIAYVTHVRPTLTAIRRAVERTPGGRVDVLLWGFVPREETPDA